MRCSTESKKLRVCREMSRRFQNYFLGDFFGSASSDDPI